MEVEVKIVVPHHIVKVKKDFHLHNGEKGLLPLSLQYEDKESLSPSQCEGEESISPLLSKYEGT